MKKIALLPVFIIYAASLVFTAGNKDTEAVVFGTEAAPVPVTYMCKDVDPLKEGDMLALFEEKIEKGLAAHGKFIDLVILPPPAGAYMNVVPIAFRTKHIAPDLIYFQGGDVPIAQEGLLENLTPYIQKSVYIKNIMGEHNKAATANYPYLLWLAPARVQIPVMREDWFQKLKTGKILMQNPTVDNYYALLKEMKESGLCTWPLTTDGTLTKLDTVFNHAFGVTATIVKQKGKWVYSVATPENKNKIAFYAKLYKEGLLDNTYTGKTWETMEQAFYEGTAGLVAGTAGGVINVYNNQMLAANRRRLIVLPPAKGIGQSYQSVDVMKESRGFAINALSHQKEAAWAVLDYMAGPEGRLLDKLGLEGIHYNVIDGKYVLTKEFPSWHAKFWPTLNGLNLGKVEGDILTQAAIDSLKAAERFFVADTNVILPENLIPLKNAMDRVYIEYATDIICGKRPLSDYDVFIEKWNKAGGNKISDYLAGVLK